MFVSYQSIRMRPTLCDDERALLLDRIKHDPALWRAEAWASYSQVRGEVERAKCKAGRDKKRRCEIEIVQRHLDAALEAMAPAPGEPPSEDDGDASAPKHRTVWFWLKQLPRKTKIYYSGAGIERTWSAIHSASAALYMAYDKTELPAQATRLRGLISALPDLDWQLASLTETIREVEKPRGDVPKARARLRQIHLDAMDATDSLQTEARTLRNTLLVASGVLFAILFLLGIMHIVNSCVFKICTTNTDHNAVCPGGRSPHSFDVFTVELAGMLGGILSAVIPLATGERIKTPYRVFNHQMMLKIFAGAGTALAGVLLVESHVVSQIKFESAATLLGYAVFFGFSQQVLTGIIDRRANDLGQKTPAVKSV